MYAHAIVGSAQVADIINRLVPLDQGDITDDTALRSTLLALWVRRRTISPTPGPKPKPRRNTQDHCGRLSLRGARGEVLR